MRIAFVGKGGSGKTTLSALFSRYLASQKFPVLAIDADINQHLAVALGASQEFSESIPALGIGINVVKDYLRGNNQRITSTASMIKTTPPGNGSRLIKISEDNPIYSHFKRTVGNVNIMATGPFSEEDLGIKCYHSKVGAVELLLSHMLDTENEYVVVDMTAGADSFASGMFAKFDITFLVCEPTIRGLSVYEQYKDRAKDYGIKIAVIGNKIETDDDLRFLKERVGSDFLISFSKSDYIKKMERGGLVPLEDMERSNFNSLEVLKEEVDSVKKDFQKLYSRTVEFHVKNSLSWANQAIGEDLTKQIDPNFSFKI